MGKLVLHRCEGQRIIVGAGLVTIHMLERTGSGCRLGIDAPNAVSVHREEIYLRLPPVSLPRARLFDHPLSPAMVVEFDSADQMRSAVAAGAVQFTLVGQPVASSIEGAR